MREQEARDRAAYSAVVRRDTRPLPLPRTAPRWGRLWRPWLWEVGVVVGALALAAAVRLSFVLSADFPLNDGGLFYIMARDVQENRFLLPWHTSYNGLDIPFAYPPLAFYLAAAVDLVGPWSLLDVMRFVPTVANVLTVGAFYLLARAVLGRGWAAAFALFLYALLPRVYLWQLGGGGLTRSLGLLWAVLALWQGYLMFRHGRGPRPLAVLFAALAVVTHPEMGWLVAFSYLLFLVAYGRSLPGLKTAATTAAAVAILTVPWWGTVVARHGLSTLVDASHTGKSDWLSWGFLNHIHIYIAEEPFFPLMAILGYGGMAVALAMGRPFLPVWFLLVLYIDPRVAGTSAMLPMAMAGGLLLATLLDIAMKEATPLPSLISRLWRGGARWAPWAYGGLALLALYAIYSSLRADAWAPTPLAALPSSVREAMDWIAHHTPEGARFVVVHGSGNPWTDSVSEWFPALTGRRSVATVQGSEWLGKETFQRQLAAFYDLQGCAYEGAFCLDRWATSFGAAYDYVFIPCAEGWECAQSLRLSLSMDSRYLLLYNGRGGYVYWRARGTALADPALALGAL